MPTFFTTPAQAKRKASSIANLRFAKGRGYYNLEPGQKPYVVPKASAAPSAFDPWSTVQQYFGSNQLMTPAQRRAEARRQVEDALAGQTKAFERERGKIREENERQQLTALGMAAAMGRLGGADAAPIRAAWEQAGGNMANFAAALTGGLQGAQQGALGAAQAQVADLAPGGVVAAPSPEANAAVTNYVGGTLPAATAQARAQAEYESAKSRGDAASARFWDQQRALEFERTKNEAELAGRFADIQAQRPKLLAEAEAGLRGQGREDLATLLSALTLSNTFSNTESLIGRRAVQNVAEKTRAATGRAQVTGVLPNGRIAPGYYRNPYTKKVAKIPSGYIADPSKPSGLRAMPSSRPPKGETAPGTKIPTQSEIRTKRTDMLEGGRERLGLIGFSKPKRWSKAQIRNYLMTQFGNDFLVTYPGQKKWVSSTVDQVSTTLWNEIQEKLKKRR